MSENDDLIAIFVYGTLRDPKVQNELIGRTLDMRDATLQGFKLSTITLSGISYPIAYPRTSHQISGKIINVSNSELKILDTYEGDEYKRSKVKTTCGTEVFIYHG